MMKRVLVLMALLMGTAWADDKTFTLSATQTWTVDMARQEAFQNAPRWIDTSGFMGVDPNLIENKQAIAAKKGKIGNRTISVFSSGSYAASEQCSPYSFYYQSNGILMAIGYDVFPSGFNPCSSSNETFEALKGYKFAYPTGVLIRLTVASKNNGEFLFEPNGALAAHWVGDKCYNADGTSCGTRKSFRY